MGRYMAALLLALILLASLEPVSVASSTSTPVNGRISRSITLYVPAVSGENKGGIIKVTVSIEYPGNGSITVSAGGAVGATTVNSVKMAFLTAAAILGVDWSTLDVSVHFETQNALEGPSASFAVSLAIAALLLPFPIGKGLEGYAITGAIAPDGLSSRVGGIPEKCGAAEAMGLILVYPTANKAEASSCSRSRDVAGLLSGLENIVNVTIPLNVNVTLRYPHAYAEIMSEEAVKMAKYAELNLTEASSKVTIPQDIYKSIVNLTSEALRLSKTKPYSAASLAFTALYRALSLNMRVKTTSPVEAEELVNNVKNKLNALRDSMPETASSWQAAELLSVAFTRLADAEASILRSEDLLKRGLYANATDEASFALARIESIKTWVRAAKSLNETGLPINDDIIKLVAVRLSQYSGISVNYSVSLLESIKKEEPFIAADVDRAINIVKTLYNRGAEELDKGNYLPAIGYFREALSESSYYIFYFGVPHGSPGVLEAYREELKRIVERLAVTNSAYGIYSILASSYVEYSDVLYSQGDRLSAVRILEHAVFSLIITGLLRLGNPSYLSLSPGELKASTTQEGVPLPTAPPLKIVDTIALLAIALVAGYLAGLTSRLRRVEEAILSRFQ